MRAACMALLLALIPASWGVPADSLVLDNAVIDQAQVIDDAQENNIAALLRDWHARDVMQAAAVVVDSTDGMADFDYAMALAERWQLGDKEKDNGLLLLIAVNDRTVRIVTGTGLEGALPDISVQKIIREHIVPALRNGDFAGAVRQGLSAAALRLQADPAVQAEMIAQEDNAAHPRSQADGTDAHTMRNVLPFFFFAFIFLQFLRRLHSNALLVRLLESLLSGAFVGAVAWFVFGWWPISLVIAIYFALQIFFARPNTRSTRRRTPRQDDDDDHPGGWTIGTGRSSGGFGGGFSSGGYGGGGGSFSGGGAGSKW